MRDVQCERAGCHSERPPSMKPPSCGAFGGHPIPNICAKPFGVGGRLCASEQRGLSVSVHTHRFSGADGTSVAPRPAPICQTAGGSADMSGVIDIATKAIPTMPALTNLDISNNHITKDLQDMLEGLCKSKSTELKL